MACRQARCPGRGRAAWKLAKQVEGELLAQVGAGRHRGGSKTVASWSSAGLSGARASSRSPPPRWPATAATSTGPSCRRLASSRCASSTPRPWTRSARGCASPAARTAGRWRPPASARCTPSCRARLVEAKEVALSAAAGLDGCPDTSGAHLAMWGRLLLTAAPAVGRAPDGEPVRAVTGESMVGECVAFGCSERSLAEAPPSRIIKQSILTRAEWRGAAAPD
jgi:hypothetical protein